MVIVYTSSMYMGLNIVLSTFPRRIEHPIITHSFIYYMLVVRGKSLERRCFDRPETLKLRSKTIFFSIYFSKFILVFSCLSEVYKGNASYN